MLKFELVRCYVKSPWDQGSSDDEQSRQVRYISLEIFRLWKYLMTRTKGFEISDEVASIWLDDEMYSLRKELLGPHKAFRVTQVYFKYNRDLEGGRVVIRYFPEEAFNQIMDCFMRNFSKDYMGTKIQQTNGYFIMRE